MRRCIAAVKPDAVIHLGDHFDDAEAMKEEYPGLRFYMVPGNCDRYRCHPNQPEILIDRVCGVELYMTHGHKHSVKSYLGALLRDARTAKVDAVLYGQTHRADLHWEEDGLLVLNPGSSGSGGSAALLELCDGKIKDCRLIDERDLTK